MISRTFHLFWDGPTMPPEYGTFADRWLDLHPGWTLERWNDKRYRSEIMSARTSRFYSTPAVWSPKSNVWQWRTNIARYEILEKLGGVWVDADLEPLRNIEPIIQGGAFIARESRAFVNNAFMGCESGHPFIVDVMSGLAARISRGRAVRSNRSTGAHYLTAVIRRHPDVLVLPSELVYPFRWNELDRRGDTFPDAYTVHHWNNRTKQTEEQ